MINIKDIIDKLNSKGIPIPLIRDPKTGPSVSLTMLFLSFNLVFFGLIGKYSSVLDIDLNQAIQIFYGTSALYFGRKFQRDPKGATIVEESSQKDQKDS